MDCRKPRPVTNFLLTSVRHTAFLYWLFPHCAGGEGACHPAAAAPPPLGQLHVHCRPGQQDQHCHGLGWREPACAPDCHTVAAIHRGCGPLHDVSADQRAGVSSCKGGFSGSSQFEWAAQWVGSAVSRDIAIVSTCRQLHLSTHAEGSSSADGGQHSSPCQSG